VGDLVRFSMYPPEKAAFSGPADNAVPAPEIALSPDGRTIAFTAAAARQIDKLNTPR